MVITFFVSVASPCFQTHTNTQNVVETIPKKNPEHKRSNAYKLN